MNCIMLSACMKDISIFVNDCIKILFVIGENKDGVWKQSEFGFL